MLIAPIMQRLVASTGLHFNHDIRLSTDHLRIFHDQLLVTIIETLLIYNEGFEDIYSQMVRKPDSRRHNISTLTPNPDVSLEIRTHIRTIYEKSAPALNLDGIRGARKALQWCFDAYCILQAPWSVVKLKKVHLMGPTRTPGFGFGIVASVALLAGEYIYELMGLLSVDGKAVHTRLSEIRSDVP
ncbi:hypothetical protein B0H14DRAFT_3452921 [Mycena olivaceomarginata]|nr:hypothetical protein B0H14DRAFT_3452921 [Mycena olivaceomarginata]